eukprot:scaffold157851_cov33-Tisochrysis_lutea.AAC.1
MRERLRWRHLLAQGRLAVPTWVLRASLLSEAVWAEGGEGEKEGAGHRGGRALRAAPAGASGPCSGGWRRGRGERRRERRGRRRGHGGKREVCGRLG